MSDIFERTRVPRHHRTDSIAELGEWYTWSSPFLRALTGTKSLIEKLPIPQVVSVKGCVPYDASYTYRLSDLSNLIAAFTLEASEALLRARVDRTLRLFCDMLRPSISSLVLHKIFALLRCGIAALQGDSRAALHSPLAPKRVDDGFRLHSDLFIVDHICLIFDDVGRGQSGKSVFLPTDILRRLIQTNNLIPPEIRSRIGSLLRGEILYDAFDECYDLLYSRKHLWTASLSNSIEQRQMTIKLKRGEGYLLNDRHWLHGRLPVEGRVSPSRFRRLVYGLPR